MGGIQIVLGACGVVGCTSIAVVAAADAVGGVVDAAAAVESRWSSHVLGRGRSVMVWAAESYTLVVDSGAADRKYSASAVDKS